MRMISHRRELTVLSLIAATTILLVGGRGFSAERTEVGVRLEFWKGHFDRNADAFHDWDKQKGDSGGLRALPRRH